MPEILQDIYTLTEHKVFKSDYEVVEDVIIRIYLKFEFTNTSEDKFTLSYTKSNYKEETGKRTGRIIDFKNKEQERLQILLDEPLLVKKSEYDSTEVPVDWFYIDTNDKSISYNSNPSKDIIRARKKLKKL